MYPDSSQFVIDLPQTLRNVKSAVLVTAEMPLTYYVFSSARGNTTLSVSVDGTARDVIVPDGNYTTSSMAAALKTALESAFAGKTFTITFHETTLTCSISVDAGVLAIDTTAATKMSDWGLGYFLGLERGAILTDGTSIVTGTRVASMNPENYLLIDIEELNGLGQSALYGQGGQGNRVFAKVPLNGDSYQYHFFDKNISHVERRPQVSSLGRLRVSIRFHDGTLVNLNGAEWSMSIEFACTLTRGV